MPNTFFTSDSHFGHKGILKVGMARPRPFASIEEHDEALIRAWNAVVRPTDIVWHLGDFAYKCQVGYAASVRARLNGRIRLILGNHDDIGRRLEWDGPVVDVQRVHVQNPGMPKPLAFWCSHYAHRTWPNSWHGDLHLYGHSHGSLPGTRTSLDVGVDCWEWAPVSLPDILRRMAETPDHPALP
ncbi:metallophosphoesterase [Methylobacterium sp. WL69]|uniref:metallophosphoesterase n=1 Tax=Methylobacterium sp. WL69 TaxID=2603893 RepID=UPI0011CA5A32|nr:metallophosphoesterase [Methylobacterium sp. WL69]TXM73146.1 metallophosphoesterase [Methylobacterium sp. WL69]